jgi:hypothetical protein
VTVANQRSVPSAPFSSRELNGEVLLAELDELRSGDVQQRNLSDCVRNLDELRGLRMKEAALRLKQLAAGRFAGQPALASLLVRWAQRLRSEADLPLLLVHFEQLALTAAMLGALRRASERLPQGLG